MQSIHLNNVAAEKKKNKFVIQFTGKIILILKIYSRVAVLSVVPYIQMYIYSMLSKPICIAMYMLHDNNITSHNRSICFKYARCELG